MIQIYNDNCNSIIDDFIKINIKIMMIQKIGEEYVFL